MRKRAETRHSKIFVIPSFQEITFDWGHQAYLSGPWVARLQVAQPALKWSLEGDKPRQRHLGTLQVTSGTARTERILEQWMKYSKKDDGKAERKLCAQNSDLLHYLSPPWRDQNSFNVTTARTGLWRLGEWRWFFCRIQEVMMVLPVTMGKEFFILLQCTLLRHPFHFLPHLVSLCRSLFGSIQL